MLCLRGLTVFGMGVTVFILVFFVQNLSNVFLSYRSPHLSFWLTEAFNTSQVLIKCAQENIPDIDWDQIRNCLNNSEVYQVRNGRVPYMRGRHPIAYVMPNINRQNQINDVFTTIYYQTMDNTEKALVMIHECAHLAFDIGDIAYSWEPKFKELTEAEHLRNADSYVQKVFAHCL